MAHPEIQLLSHIIRHGVLNEALDWGIREDDFVTDEGRSIFQHLLMMRRDPRFRGGLMGPNVMQQLYPNFDFCDDGSMTIEAYCTLTRNSRLAIEIQTAARELAAGGSDPMGTATKCLERLQRNVLSVGYGVKNDVHFYDAVAEAARVHDLQASGHDLSIAKWPWEPFNTTSGGLQEDDYIVFYGRPKSKKSWVLAAFIASLFLQDKRPLIYTKEMTANNIFQRVAACIAGLPYQEFRTGRLSQEERIRLANIQDATSDMRDTQPMICLNGKDANGSDTIDWLQAKVKKYRPDVVFIDGLYLMNDHRGAKGQKDNFRVQNISRAARQMVLETGVPVIATMQATRAAAAHRSANLDEIAYSDAIAQDVTAAIRVINEDEEEKITLVVGGSREYRFSGCQIWGIPATNFDFIKNLSQREIDKIKQRDERVDEKESGTTAEANSAQSKAQVDKKKLAYQERKNLHARIAGAPNSLRVPGR